MGVLGVKEPEVGQSVEGEQGLEPLVVPQVMVVMVVVPVGASTS